MSTLLAAISDATGFQLVHGTIWKELLRNKHEGAQDIMILLLGKVFLMNIVTNFVV